MTWPAGYGYLPLGEVGSTLDEAARRFPELQRPDLDHRHPPDRRARPARPGLGEPCGQFRRHPGPAGASTPRRAALRSFVAALALHEACVAVTGRPEALRAEMAQRRAAERRQARRHPARKPDAGRPDRRARDRHRREPRRGAGAGGGRAGRAAPGVARRRNRRRRRPRGLPRRPRARPIAALGGAARHLRLRADPHRLAGPRRAARRDDHRAPARRGDSPAPSATVDEAGHLVLSTPRGLRRIAAADIFF